MAKGEQPARHRSRFMLMGEGWVYTVQVVVEAGSFEQGQEALTDLQALWPPEQVMQSVLAPPGSRRRGRKPYGRWHTLRVTPPTPGDEQPCALLAWEIWVPHGPTIEVELRVRAGPQIDWRADLLTAWAEGADCAKAGNWRYQDL